MKSTKTPSPFAMVLLWLWLTRTMMGHTLKVCSSTSSPTSGQVCSISTDSLKSLLLQFWKYLEELKSYKVSLRCLSTKTGRKVKISSRSKLSTTKVWELRQLRRQKTTLNWLTSTRLSLNTRTTKTTRLLNLHLLRNLQTSVKSGLSLTTQWLLL